MKRNTISCSIQTPILSESTKIIIHELEVISISTNLLLLITFSVFVCPEKTHSLASSNMITMKMSPWIDIILSLNFEISCRRVYFMFYWVAAHGVHTSYSLYVLFILDIFRLWFLFIGSWFWRLGGQKLSLYIWISPELLWIFFFSSVSLLQVIIES